MKVVMKTVLQIIKEETKILEKTKVLEKMKILEEMKVLEMKKTKIIVLVNYKEGMTLIPSFYALG